MLLSGGCGLLTAGAVSPSGRPRNRWGSSERFTFYGIPATLVLMFREALQGVVEGTDGGLAGVLMDFEGIALETYVKQEAGMDIEAVGAEVSVVVKAIQRATEMLDAGDTKEVSFKSERMVTLIRVVNEMYFLALTMKPDGNFGKGRFMLRTTAPRLLSELE